MSDYILETRQLSKSFCVGFWLRRVRAVDRIDLQVHRGETLGILGANGAGKSTLFKMMTGLLRPSSGEGWVEGKPFGAKAARREVGYLPENPAVYEFLSGWQFMSAMGSLAGLEPAQTRRRAAALLDRVGLAAAKNVLVRKYSKGMVQRLALAQVLLCSPPLCILDEPMSGLDPVGRRMVRDVVAELRAEGKTVIFSSHTLADAEALCDRVALMVKGRIVALGRVAELLQSSTLAIDILVECGVHALPAMLQDGAEAREQGGETLLRFADEAVAQRTLRELTATGFKILGVQRHRESLEDYFIRSVAAPGEATPTKR